MIPGTVLAAIASYALMLVAYKLHRIRAFHIPVMASCILFDLAMPFYLYMNRPWYKRLVEGGEILSIGVWMHVAVLIILYFLYAAQVGTGWRLLRGDYEPRGSHHGQAKAIVWVRALVIFSGAMLYVPESDSEAAAG